jgi:hypothetical protein
MDPKGPGWTGSGTHTALKLGIGGENDKIGNLTINLGIKKKNTKY